ncbi:MAG: nitroreductase family protein [Bdellovibrionales bacterium]|nr:nitroreductase family protein [Bdellovibrionales bacterium]
MKYLVFLLLSYNLVESASPQKLSTSLPNKEISSKDSEKTSLKKTEESSFQGMPTQNKSVVELMESRYTVRTFKTKDVKKEDLDQILRAGLLSPSKNRLFPYKIVVLTNSRRGKKLKKKLWSKYAICYHCSETGEKMEQRINSIITAPVNIMFFLDLKPDVFDKNRIYTSLIKRSTRDAMIPATVMMLQAEQLGYGTAFTGVYNDKMEEFKKELQINAENKYLVTLSIGHREELTKTNKKHKDLLIDFDCIGKPETNSRYIALKYSNKRDQYGNLIPSIISNAIDVGPKNTEKTELIKKY